MALGIHVLLVDYRGYGRSEGSPSEAGAYADARAGLAHLTGERGIPEQRIVVFGRSIGSAVAVDAARDRPLAGLVLESPFPSLTALVRALYHLPLGWLTGQRFESGRKISAVRCPILFFHGERDTIVPIELGRELYALAPEPKAFETIRGAGHNDTVQVGGRAYFERFQRFLDGVAPH